jgi:hypothetical protein
MGRFFFPPRPGREGGEDGPEEAEKMRRLLLPTAALAALAVSPALANRDIVPDNNMNFAETVELFRTAAMHQPTFKTVRRCSLDHGCATVEFAVRENEDGADFFIYPDKAPKDVIWCFVSNGHTDARLCQKAGTEPRTTVMWMEAYSPRAGEFREIDYGNVMDPDCKAFQHSKYDIDEDYIACVVRKLDVAPPPPSLGAGEAGNAEAARRQDDARGAARYRFAVLASGHVCDKADEVHDPDTAPGALPGHARLFCDNGAHVYVLKHYGDQWQYSSTAANR